MPPTGGADGKSAEPLILLLHPALSPALQLAFRNQVMAALGGVRADELTVKAGKLFGLPVAPGSAADKDWPEEIGSAAIATPPYPRRFSRTSRPG